MRNYQNTYAIDLQITDDVMAGIVCDLELNGISILIITHRPQNLGAHMACDPERQGLGFGLLCISKKPKPQLLAVDRPVADPFNRFSEVRYEPRHRIRNSLR